MADETVLEDIVAEGKLSDIWPKYPCLYDVRSRDFRHRNKREKAIADMFQKLERTTELYIKRLEQELYCSTLRGSVPISHCCRRSHCTYSRTQIIVSTILKQENNRNV